MKRKAWSMAAIALCVLLAFGTLAACKDKTKNPPDDNGSDPVYAITLDRTTLGLELGSVDKLTATLQKDGETTDVRRAFLQGRRRRRRGRHGHCDQGRHNDGYGIVRQRVGDLRGHRDGKLSAGHRAGRGRCGDTGGQTGQRI